jgi:hypothetical protein
MQSRSNGARGIIVDPVARSAIDSHRTKPDLISPIPQIVIPAKAGIQRLALFGLRNSKTKVTGFPPKARGSDEPEPLFTEASTEEWG